MKNKCITLNAKWVVAVKYVVVLAVAIVFFSCKSTDQTTNHRPDSVVDNANRSKISRSDDSVTIPNPSGSGQKPDESPLDSEQSTCDLGPNDANIYCEIEEWIHVYTNEIRAQVGLAPFLRDPQAQWASRRWSQQQANRNEIGHEGFPLRRNDEILGKYGRLETSLGSENVAMFGGFAQTDAKGVAKQLTSQWRNSKTGHYEAMIATNVTHHGAGVFKRGDSWFGTQIMSRR